MCVCVKNTFSLAKILFTSTLSIDGALTVLARWSFVQALCDPCTYLTRYTSYDRLQTDSPAKEQYIVMIPLWIYSEPYMSKIVSPPPSLKATQDIHSLSVQTVFQPNFAVCWRQWIRFKAYQAAVKLDRRLCSCAAELPVRPQCDTTICSSNLPAPEISQPYNHRISESRSRPKSQLFTIYCTISIHVAFHLYSNICYFQVMLCYPSVRAYLFTDYFYWSTTLFNFNWRIHASAISIPDQSNDDLPPIRCPGINCINGYAVSGKWNVFIPKHCDLKLSPANQTPYMDGKSLVNGVIYSINYACMSYYFRCSAFVQYKYHIHRRSDTDCMEV